MSTIRLWRIREEVVLRYAQRQSEECEKEKTRVSLVDDHSHEPSQQLLVEGLKVLNRVEATSLT